MPVNFLGFDIEKYIKRVFAPYAKWLSGFVFLVTAILSLIVLVPSIRDAAGFIHWNDWAVIIISLTWFIGIIISFVLILHSFGITLNQFGNFIVALDVALLVLIIIVTNTMPGQQICGLSEQCGLVGNGLFLFIFFQPLIIGTYARIKYRYYTGRDILLQLRKMFGSKS